MIADKTHCDIDIDIDETHSNMVVIYSSPESDADTSPCTKKRKVNLLLVEQYPEFWEKWIEVRYRNTSEWRECRVLNGVMDKSSKIMLRNGKCATINFCGIQWSNLKNRTPKLPKHVIRTLTTGLCIWPNR